MENLDLKIQYLKLKSTGEAQQKREMEPSMVAYMCNPSYLGGGGDQEGLG
jgi:hypothetical protein